ncbi:MAG: hypothetical protein JWO95_380 [Verrucomicrobiales bacterium]|nr:hypothetical protein [Verrucomicrobiales bacterium]
MALETNRVAYQDQPTTKESSSTLGGREHQGTEHHEGYETAQKMTTSGAGIAALLGLVTVLMAILGLLNVAPLYMAGISAVALGVSMLLVGGFSMEWFTAPREHFFYEGEGAMGTEVMAGVGGIVLGILALMGVAPDLLLPVAILSFGISLFLSSWITASHFSGIKCLPGLAGIILGILALTGVAPITLTLVGFLVLGFGVLFSGSITASKHMYAAQSA